MGGINKYEWTIKSIPKPHIISKHCKILNAIKYIPIVRRIIYKRINNILGRDNNISFVPGIYIQYNNLKAKNVDISNCFILDYANVIIGEHTVIGPDCKIITSWHLYENFNQIRAADIVIGNNVWITMNCIILGGVKIGDNSVIGAGSLVSRDIPENVLAAGNPARVIKQIDREYKWWKDPDYLRT